MKKESGKKSIDLSHHAYLVMGDLNTCNDIRNAIRADKRVNQKDGHDFIERHFETLTIDDSRELKALAEMRPVNFELKIIIIETKGITIEAQNALLKLFEEPADYVRFFLILPSSHLVLPTIKSRMLLIDLRSNQSATPTGPIASNDMGDSGDSNSIKIIEDAKSFIETTLPKRLEIIKKLTDEISKDKKTKYDALAFLNAVEKVTYESQTISSKVINKTKSETFKAISNARSYMDDRAPSVKMLLEYVAMNI